MEKKVLTIVVTYNPTKWIDNLLQSLFNSIEKTDILIIDNCSTDGFLTKINTYEKNDINLPIIVNKKNFGFGKANNIGLRYALDHNYQYVYLLNQDAWVEPDTLSKLINAHRLFPEFALLSPMQINANGKIDSSFDYYFFSKSHAAPIEKDNVIIKESDSNAAHWLLSRETLIKVGGFLPSFWLYGEDENYLQRVKFKGLKCGVVMNCFGVHDRENRNSTVINLDKKFYREYVETIVAFSNPLCRRSIKDCYHCFYGYLRSAKQYKSLLPIKYLFTFILSMPQIIYNRLLSMTKEKAFL